MIAAPPEIVLGCFDCGAVLEPQALDQQTYEQFVGGDIALPCPRCGYILHDVTPPEGCEPEPEILPCWGEALADVDIAGLLDGQVPA